MVMVEIGINNIVILIEKQKIAKIVRPFSVNVDVNVNVETLEKSETPSHMKLVLTSNPYQMKYDLYFNTLRVYPVSPYFL